MWGQEELSEHEVPVPFCVMQSALSLTSILYLLTPPMKPQQAKSEDKERPHPHGSYLRVGPLSLLSLYHKGLS